MSPKVTYKPFGESALLIEWPAEINESILYEILKVQKLLEKKLEEVLIESVNAYNSLTLIYRKDVIDYDRLLSDIKNCLQTIKLEESHHKNRIWNIPVCYDEEFAIDLNEMTLSTGLGKDEMVALHKDSIYIVYFLGFLPGFLYLGGLHPSLHFPRKSTPRLKIAKGAVAIGGIQTGIYPTESPGGWNIIGNCPIELFDVKKNPPCFIKSGDKVKFYSIDLETHSTIKMESLAGKHEISSVWL